METGIYKITCTENNRFYIGSAKKINKRCQRHINDLKNNKHINIHLQRAYNKYGKVHFHLKLLKFAHSIHYY